MPPLPMAQPTRNLKRNQQVLRSPQNSYHEETIAGEPNGVSSCGLLATLTGAVISSGREYGSIVINAGMLVVSRDITPEKA